MSITTSASAAPSSTVATSATAPESQVLSQQNVPQTAPEVKPEAKNDDKFASKFAALSKKERELREREGKSKAEIEAAKKQAEEYKTKYGKYEGFEEKIKADKREGVRFLLEQGYTTEEIADIVLEEMNPDPEKRRQKEQSELEKRLFGEIENLKKQLTQREQDEIEAAKKAEQDNFEKTVTQVKTELKDYIDQSEEFELIKLNGEYETVFDVMQEHYNDQLARGIAPEQIKLLSYEEAAKWTETYLEEQARKAYEVKFAKKQATTKTPEQQKTSPTLSNTLSTEVQSSGEPKPKTREESLARAARFLRYNEE